MTQLDADKIQCARCGRNGFPPAECENCHGQAEVEARQYTLSEVRAGRAPHEERKEGLGPKIINLPGSFNPTQGSD